MTHDLYTDVPKLLISSNSIRLLNVVGQGTLNFHFTCNIFQKGLSALAKEDDSDEQTNTTGILVYVH